MKLPIFDRLFKCLALVGFVSLAVLSNPAVAGAPQYRCLTTYAWYVQSKQPAVPAASVNARPAPAMSLMGLPMLFSRTQVAQPAPAQATSTVLLAPLNKVLPRNVNRTWPQGLFYTPEELALWRHRAASGPFKTDNDFAKGTPGDWQRIVQHAEGMVNGTLHETPTHVLADPNFNTNGTRDAGFLLLDTAFAYLISNDVRYLNAAKTTLLQSVTDPTNDLSKRCFSVEVTDGVNPPTQTYTDGFLEAQWLNRTIMAYDFMKHGMSDSERAAVEGSLLKWGYFLGAHMQWGLEYLFPNRAVGDYTEAQRVKNWESDPYDHRTADTNKDCLRDSLDDQTMKTVRLYATSTGAPGPAISKVSLSYNNRRSNQALSIAMIGILLNEPNLVGEAKRYVSEWLNYSVWSDGSQGEYQRNGDYCIPQQGLIYGAINISAALAIADVTARKGDASLYKLSTAGGLFGTQAAAGTAKSLLTPVMRHLNLISGVETAYYFERDRAVQNPRPETSLGAQESRYFNAAKPLDNYYDLAYLLSNRYYQLQPMHDAIMRLPQGGPNMPPFPGTTGNGVSGWTGSSTIFPAMLMMYGELPTSIWPYPFSTKTAIYKN